MALYVAVVLDAALLTLDPHGITILQLVWGTCLGLVLAHLFAFALAARLAGGGQRDQEDRELALAQLTGAVTIAALATVPLLLLGEPNELLGVELVLSACIGVAAYVEGTGVGPYEGAHVRVETTGDVVVATGLTTQGQGHQTVFAQIAAQELGVPVARVTVTTGPKTSFCTISARCEASAMSVGR